MSKKRKKVLKTNEIKIGSVDEILNLTPAESEMADYKLFLADALKEAREVKSLTQNELANILNTSQSRIAKIESCDPSVTIDLILKAHTKLGVSIKELNQKFAKQSEPKRAEIITGKLFGHIQMGHRRGGYAAVVISRAAEEPAEYGGDIKELDDEPQNAAGTVGLAFVN